MTAVLAPPPLRLRPPEAPPARAPRREPLPLPVLTPPSAPQPSGAGTGRDAALDLLRAVALARVVLWHAFAAPWMTFFAAIPLMFFVAGTLLGASREKRSYPALVLRRAKRLLVPLWAYGVVVAVASGVHTKLAGVPAVLGWDTARSVATWVVPLVDPAGSAWHGGWLSDHLWYLRAYLWVVLLAPLFTLLARRLAVGIPVVLAGVGIVLAAPRLHLPVIGSGTGHLLAGDVLVYGLFAMLGMAYRARRWSPNRAALAIGATLAAGATAVLVALGGVPGGDVNQSYPAILLVGTAWLFAAGACEPWLRRVARIGRVQRLTLPLNRRAETVYLWHPAAIVVAYAVLDHVVRLPAAIAHAPAVHAVALIALTAALTAAVTIAVGWIEDLGAGRRRRHARQPRHLPTLRFVGLSAAAAPVSVALALATPLLLLPSAASAAGSGHATKGVRPPSYREALTGEAFATTTATSAPGALVLTDGKLPADRLDAALAAWRSQHPEVTSIATALSFDGHVWTGDSTGAGAPVTLQDTDTFAAASLTKSFTLTLVLQQVAAGRIALDAPVPPLDGVTVPAGVVITPRQLLQHSSGLVDYSMAAGFSDKMALTPAGAVSLSLRTPLQSAPGAQVHYANVNYLYLGLLLEKVTGTTYAALVDRAAASLGLTHTHLDSTPVPGWVGFSSGGIRSTVGDLATWESAVFTPGKLLPASLVHELTTLDAHNVGLGTWPLCPCSTDPDGTKRSTAMGHYIANGGMYHYPDGAGIVVRVEPQKANSEALIESLGEQLRAVLRNR